MSNRELLALDTFIDNAKDEDLVLASVKILSKVHARGLLSLYIPLDDGTKRDTPPVTDVADAIDSIHVNGPGMDILVVGKERFTVTSVVK